MASITIRNLDEALKKRLRIRAAHSHHSMEEEVRRILRDVLSGDQPEAPTLSDAIRNRFSGLGGFELELPEREPIREPPEFTA